jgi:lipoprotein-anchoring transpeptidase ErfK/SrfK
MTAARAIVAGFAEPWRRPQRWRQMGVRDWGTGMFDKLIAWRTALRRIAMGAAALTAVGALAAPAAAEVLITVDKSTQQMSVTVDGYQRYTWAVSTGLHGGPPSGTFHPQRMERMWYSHAFGMAPMPHSIFFRGPFAIHGTMIVSRLGHPASHGCVRLHPDNASTLFDLVQQEGAAHTRIVIR